MVEPLAEPETQVVQAELLVELLVERIQHYYRNPYRTLRNRCLLYRIENKPSFVSPLFNVVNTRVQVVNYKNTHEYSITTIEMHKTTLQ